MAKPYDSTVAELENLLESSRQVRRLYERQWLLNIAYYLGNHWISVDTAGLLYAPNIGAERVTLTENRIRPAVRIAIAKQTKTAPQWVGVPKDPSDEEIMRARLRSIVFEHYWRELQARRKLNSALWWRECTGAGFWKQTWDKTAGETMTVMARKGGGVIADAYGRPFTPDTVGGLVQQMPALVDQLEPKQIATGDICLEVVSPWEMFPDALADESGLQSCEHVSQESIYSPEYLKRQYPDKADEITATSPPNIGVMESRFPGLGAAVNGSNRGGPGRRGVKVREHWSRGPDGRHCVWTADGTLLLEEANPYPFLPYAMFSGLPAGRFWADASVSDLISPNTELNKTKSQVAENIERFGNPARYREAASSDVSDWNGLPGEEITYVDTGSGLNVGFIQPPEMPVYVQNYIPQQVEAINALSGQQEVAQGTVPDGVTAASAISMLLEANDTQLGPQIAEMGDAILDSGKQLLWYLRAFAKTERMARIAGDESMYDIYAWQGERLGDAGADEVEVGSGISTSVAAQQATIHDMLNLLIQNGQAPPPRELRKLIRSLGVGGVENFFATLGKDQRQVADENRRLMQGEQVTRNNFDNDQTHLDDHQDYQKSSSYRERISKPDGQIVQMQFEAHVQEHRQVLQDQANEQAAAQANMQALAAGNPGTGAAPPPPPAGMNGSTPPDAAVSSGP